MAIGNMKRYLRNNSRVEPLMFFRRGIDLIFAEEVTYSINFANHYVDN